MDRIRIRFSVLFCRELPEVSRQPCRHVVMFETRDDLVPCSNLYDRRYIGMRIA